MEEPSEDDRWEEDTPEHHQQHPDERRHCNITMGDTHKGASGLLPAISGGGPPPPLTVPTPPPPIMFKSKLKPPTQRATLLPAFAKNGGRASSPLKLPMLVKPTASSNTPRGALEDERTRAEGNQEAEDEVGVSGSSRALMSGPRGSVVDKNRDFIKGLEEQKRKEKEELMKQEVRKKKMQKKRTERILEEAALARQRQQEEREDVPEETTTVEDKDAQEDAPLDDEDKKEKDKEAKRQRRKLLKKQQALLEKLQTKKKEKQEEEEYEKEKERRRQEKLKKAVLDGIHSSKAEGVEEEEVLPEEEGHQEAARGVVPEEEQDEIQEENQSTVRIKKRTMKKGRSVKRVQPEQHASEGAAAEGHMDGGGGGGSVAERKAKHHHTSSAAEDRPAPSSSLLPATPTEDLLHPPEDNCKTRTKEQGVATKKQQEYLAKLAELRRQKQKEDDDAKILQEKRRKRVQNEAHQRLQEAAAKQRILQQEIQQSLDKNPVNPMNPAPVPVNVDAMVARLSKLKDKDSQVIPEARDFSSWKKRHGVRPDQKVFCMSGWYPVIREELEKRGWFYNNSGDKTSPFFDLKWSLKSDDLKGIKLKEDQYVNHFFSNTAITTKVGLIHTLRGVSWHNSVDIDAIFPRAYDLNEPRDMDAFVMDFRYSFAEGVLKQVAKRILLAQVATHEKKTGSLRLNEAFVEVLTSIARKKLKTKRALEDERSERGGGGGGAADPLEESVDDVLSVGVEELVSDLEWEVLTKCAIDTPGKFRASLTYKKKRFVDDKDTNGGQLVGAGDAVGGGGSGGPGSVVVDTVLSALEKKQQKQLDKLHMESFQRDKAKLSGLLTRVSPLREDASEKLLALTRALEKACPQFHLNGGGDLTLDDAQNKSRNVWIVKPAGLSRGRGIRVFNQLDELLAYADVENHKECQWVAQKYIENPLLIANRKFDIRQWVLVTSWDPLTIWFYEDFYLRLSSEEYSMDDLSDQYVHLTNNSIQKYSDKFNDVYTTDTDGAAGALEIEGNMMHSDEFKQYISDKMHVDDNKFETQLHAKMKEIVVQSLQCAQDLIQHRKNCCELYGYDFMLDETLRPWLIEVNSSPACDYSTPTAKKYVETGLSGIVKVIVDHREYETKKKMNGNGLAAGAVEPHTGRWRRIHKAEYIGKPVSSFGADFQVKGTKVTKTRGAKKQAVAVAVTALKSSSSTRGIEVASESAAAAVIQEEEEEGEDVVRQVDHGDRARDTEDLDTAGADDADDDDDDADIETSDTQDDSSRGGVEDCSSDAPLPQDDGEESIDSLL